MTEAVAADREVERLNEEAREEAEDRAYADRVRAGDVDVLDLLGRYERARSDVRYAKGVLRGCDVYGSGGLDGMAREASTRMRERDARVDELLADASRLENERRGWKLRAESALKLLSATLVEMRVSGGPRGNAAAEMVKEVAARADRLEADAWCRAAAVARSFVEACSEPMGDYAPLVVRPGDGDRPEHAFLRAWILRFEDALKTA